MKRKRFCPGCGKTIEGKLEFCTDCKPLEEFEFKDISFDFCSRCNSYLSKNKWKKTDNLNQAIIEIAKEKIKNEITHITPIIPDVTIAPGVNVNFEFEFKKNMEEYVMPGKVLITICPKCSKEGSTYFEGILQIRNPKDEVIEYIKKELEKVKDKGIYANNVIEVKGGIDFYMSSKKYLRKLGREIKKRFPGTHNESPQLFSRNNLTSKDIYRLNVLFRCE